MAGDGFQNIPDTWDIRRLDDVSTIIDSSHKTPAYTEAGYPMVRVTDVKGGFLDLSETLRVSEDVFKEFTRRYVPQRGDIVFSRRVNETLEAMARAIFKSWFVDFDPVRAKARTKSHAKPHAECRGEACLAPTLPKSIADLFPDSFEESTYGEKVPREFRACTWGDLITLEYGRSLKDYGNGNGAFPVYGTNGRIGSYHEALCSHPGVIVGRKGAYRGIHFCSTPFFVIDTAFFVEPRGEVDLRWAYYELLRQDINSMDSGSAIPSTSRADFYGLPVIYPPPRIQRLFSETCGPLWARQEQNDGESRTLAALRDTLLPKLISGELRLPAAVRDLATQAGVKDAERIVGRHV